MKLTLGEHSLLMRRRLGLTQLQAARRMKKGIKEYRQIETSTVEGFSCRTKPHEEALILRRRQGWTQAQLARKLRCCRFWLRKMENGTVDCTALTNFWANENSPR